MEKSLFDTNRLIDAYREKGNARWLWNILKIIYFRKAIEFNLRVMFPSKSDYHLALKISTELLKAGKPIPAVDSVIAAVVFNNKLKLVTKDKHFLFIKKVLQDFMVDVV